MKIEIDTDKAWDVTIDLIKLAQYGVGVTPLDFVIAARHHPDYDVEKAVHIEQQLFDKHGVPFPGDYVGN